MTSTPSTPQKTRNTRSKFTTAPFPEDSYEGPQAYNTSAPELDLRNQPPLELAYQEPVNRGLQHEEAPSQEDKTRPRSLRRSTILLSIALGAVIISIAVVGGTVGSLVKKEKVNALSDSKDASAINSETLIFSRTTVFAQQSVSRTTASSSMLSISSVSSAASSSSSSSLAPPSYDKGSSTITVGPSETYSIESSPTLTLSRDCPGSNGTTIVTNDNPPQYFIKNCNWLYTTHEPSGDAFSSVTSTLDACISLCAAYNASNQTKTCSAVEWRWEISDKWFPGSCWGMVDQQAGIGEPAPASDENTTAPVDAALFLGWSQWGEECEGRGGVTIDQKTGPMTSSQRYSIVEKKLMSWE